MGLFGLFATMIGLGAMAKDGISSSRAGSQSYERAKANGTPYYFTGDGAKIKSMKTGQPCHVVHDTTTKHTLVVDSKTGNVIEDMTLTKNRKTEEQEKRQSPSRCVFYRKCEWDTINHKCNVWVSDRISGYFYHMPSCYKNCCSSKVDEYSLFYKGELRDPIASHGEKEVRATSYVNMEVYFADGTRYSDEEMDKRQLVWLKQLNKEKGYKFYPVDRDARVSSNKRMQHATIAQNFFIYDLYRDVDTDDVYVANKTEKYLVKAIRQEITVNVAQPHHQPIYQTRTKYIEDPNGERFNADGTKWYS